MRLVQPAWLLLAACSSLSNNEDGIASLEIRLPRNLYLELGLPLQLQAVARDQDGAPVDVEIAWRTPDTTISLDPTGLITPLFDVGIARVQAGVVLKDTLVSGLNNLSFTLTVHADSLRLAGPDSLVVATDTEDSPALDLRLIETAGGTGVAGRPIGYEIIEPAPTESPAVVLRTGRMTDSLISGPTGGPAAPMTVRAATGRTPPDRVVVLVTAFRASGAPIPGSGRQVVIRFEHR